METGNLQPATWLSRGHLALAGLLVFTLVIRGGVLWAMRGNLNQDPDAYREIAENLLVHGKFALGKPGPYYGISWPKPTAYRPPLYPMLLSKLPVCDEHQVSLIKVAVLHLVLGIATVWLTWLTAWRYFANYTGPEGRQEVAPTIRSGVIRQQTRQDRSGGPTPGGAEEGDGPPGLSAKCDSETPTLRSGLLPIGPPGLWIAPLVAGLLVACDPILLNQQTLVMTETLAAFLAILSLWCLARFDESRTWFDAAMTGGAIGLAILCRPTFLPWLGLVGLAMLLAGRRKSEVRGQKSERRFFHDIAWRLGSLAALGITAAAITSPWAVRNYHVFGQPIVTTTHGGYTLVLANNDSFYAHLLHPMTSLPWQPSALFWLGPSDDPFIFHNGEVAADAWHYKLAWQAIARNQQAFLLSCIYRVRQLWSPLPHKLTKDESTGRMLMRYGTCAWYCGVYALAAVGVWNLSRGWGVVGAAHPTGTPQRAFPTGPWIWGVLLCLAFTAVHTFYWTNLRMRAPLMPFVAMVAAAAVMSKVPSPRSKVQG